MTESFTSRLPRVMILLHHATGLSKANTYVKIRKKGNVCLSQVIRGKFALTPIWNEEFRYRIEANSENPFLAHIWVYSAHPSGGPDTPLGYSEFDLYHDLGIRREGDRRKWTFKLNTQGEVTLSFIAQTDFNFPHMDMENHCGDICTSMLPRKEKPELDLTIYQCIDLKGEKPLQSYIKVEQFTYDLSAPIGTNPKRWKLLMRTGIFRGYSPFWGEKCKIVLSTKDDTIRMSLIYVLGSSKTFQESEEEIAVLTVPEILKGCTSTESLLWYKFNGIFKGAAIGIGLLATSDMSVVGSLPEAPLFFEEVREAALQQQQVQVNKQLATTVAKLPLQTQKPTQPQTKRQLQEDKSKLVRRSIILDNDSTYNTWSEDEPSEEEVSDKEENEPLIFQAREASSSEQEDVHDSGVSSLETDLKATTEMSSSSGTSGPKKAMRHPSVVGGTHMPRGGLSPEEQYKFKARTPEEQYKYEAKSRGGGQTKKTIKAKKLSKKKAKTKNPEETYKERNRSAEENYRDKTGSTRGQSLKLPAALNHAPPVSHPKTPPTRPSVAVSKPVVLPPAPTPPTTPTKAPVPSTLQRQHFQQKQHQRQHSKERDSQPAQSLKKSSDGHTEEWSGWESVGQKMVPHVDKFLSDQQEEEIRRQQEEIEKNNIPSDSECDSTWDDWDSVHPDCAKFYELDFYHSWMKENSSQEEEQKNPTDNGDWDDWDSVHPDCEEFYVPDFYHAWCHAQGQSEVEEETEAEDTGEWSDWDSVHPDCSKYYAQDFYHSWWAPQPQEEEEEEGDARNEDTQSQLAREQEYEVRGRDSADDRGRNRGQLQEDEEKAWESLEKLLVDSQGELQRALDNPPVKGSISYTSMTRNASESPSRALNLRSEAGRTSMGLLRSLSDNYEKNKSNRDHADPYMDATSTDSCNTSALYSATSGTPSSSSFSHSPPSSPSLSPIPPHSTSRTQPPTPPLMPRTGSSVPHPLPPKWLSGSDGHSSTRSPSSPPSPLTRQFFRSSESKSPSGSNSSSAPSSPTFEDSGKRRKILRNSGTRPIRIAVTGATGSTQPSGLVSSGGSSRLGQVAQESSEDEDKVYIHL